MAAARLMGGHGRGGILALLLVGSSGVLASGCARPRAAEVYPQLSEYAGRVLEDVEFLDTDPFPADSLDALTETEATRCRWLGIFPFCFPGTRWGLRERQLDPETVGRDIAVLTALYRQSGFFGTTVEPEVTELAPPRGGPVRLSFVIQRADPVILESLEVEGTEGIADPDSLAAELPLQPGERFDLARFVASADSVVAALRGRGHAYAEVLRNYAVDTIQDRATAVLVAIPGPRVQVDSIIVTGLDELDRRTVLRQLTFRQGDLLERRELVASQRNLYELEMTQFVTVTAAPDSLQLTPRDSTMATVLVQMVEAREHLVETVAGWGTEECGRVGARWVDRSFTGGARRLSLAGSVRRIPVACRDEPEQLGRGFVSEWDYRVAAELRQPYFLSPRNNLVLTAFAEQQSEPTLFQRTAQGGRLAVARRLSPRELLSTAVEIEHRRTEAVPALYCAAFAVCTPDDIALLAGARWRNALSANWIRDASNRVVNPTGGYTLQANALWASPLLLSDYDFLRISAEGAVYREVARRWVLAAYLRAGSFVTSAGFAPGSDFIPPEERFYAGGAGSVRGYARSRLGPGIWLYEGQDDPDPLARDLDVTFFPTGGTSVVVSSLEARFPSPFLDDLLDLAAFVDAGAVGVDPVWELTSQWRVTPGAGVRISTPVGPLRVDVAYNPYPSRRAPLYVQDFETGNLVERGTYRPPDPSFWSRLQLHIALGQAF